MLTFALFFIVILNYTKWILGICGVLLLLFSLTCVPLTKNEDEEKEVKKMLKYSFLLIGLALLIAVIRTLLICHVDHESALMYVLGKDYMLSKGASSLIPKVGNLIDSAADSL